MEGDFERVLRAMRVVHAQPAGTGTIACPECQGGTITYERWSHPGRARGSEGSRAKCSTEGCVKWIT